MASLGGGGPIAELFVGLVCLLSSFALGLAVPLLLVRARGWRLILPGDELPVRELPSPPSEVIIDVAKHRLSSHERDLP
jgi:hypothetical protein